MAETNRAVHEVSESSRLALLGIDVKEACYALGLAEDAEVIADDLFIQFGKKLGKIERHTKEDVLFIVSDNSGASRCGQLDGNGEIRPGTSIMTFCATHVVDVRHENGQVQVIWGLRNSLGENIASFVTGRDFTITPVPEVLISKAAS